MQGSARPALSGRLIVLTLIVLAPVVAAGVWLGISVHRTAEDAADHRVLTAARTAAHAADAEIEGRRLALQALGSLLDGERGLAELAAADAMVRRAAEAIGTPIGILDRGLGMLIDTAQPFGTPLASTLAVAAGLWAIETGRARASDRLAGSAAPPMLLVPFLRNGRAEAVLSVPLTPERLAAAAGPARTALLDSRGRVIVVHGEGTGEPPDWLTVLAAAQGQVARAPDGQGRSLRFAVAYLAEAPDWRAVAWEPAGASRGDLFRSVALGSLAAALLVLLVALRSAMRSVRGPVQALARHFEASATALRADASPPPLPPVSAPAEFSALLGAIAEAREAGLQRERRLRALAEAGALVLWRADVTGGWSEAAGWAGLTGQTAPAFRGDGWIEMLHPDDRAPTLAEWGRALVARGTIGVEFRLRSAGGADDWRWVRATGVPVIAEDGALVEWVGTIQDVTEARGAGAAQRINEQQVRQTVAELRAVYDTVPVGLALVDGSLRFVNVNARFAAISGLPPETHIARTPHEVMPEGLAAPLEAAQREVLATGRPVLDVTCTGQSPGAVQNLRHWLASCHPVKDAVGVVTGVSAVLQDVTERVRAERSREMLVAELSHRVKNTLATVQSIAAQSLRRVGGGPPGFARDFVGRLQALTRCQELLAEQEWNRVDLARVAQVGLAPWLDARKPIRIGGSGRIQVDAAQTQALILAMHELATNALKHGALSRQGGEVDVTWSLGEDGLARLEWRESGGPPVAVPPPDRRGFGMRLLERGLVHDLGPGADVSVTFPEDGLVAVMRFRVGVPALEPVAAA